MLFPSIYVHFPTYILYVDIWIILYLKDKWKNFLSLFRVMFGEESSQGL